MASSGTYSFNPSLGRLTIQAFGMCGIRPTALLQEHFESANMSANLVLGDWANKGVNLWKVSSVTVPFVQGTNTYSVSTNIVEILDLYMTVTGGAALTNRYLFPVSRTEYVSYPNPTQQDQPTVYWHNRTLTPTISFYPTPDGTEQSFTYYAVTQIQDAALTNGQTLDIPYAWLNAFAKAFAADLAITWAFERVETLQTIASAAWTVAAETNTEISAFYISPTLTGYWR